MASMTWFWRLVCSPECGEACQTDCPGCHAMASEWEAQGRQTLHVQPSPGPMTWTKVRNMWTCWSRSTSARMLRALHPGRLIGRGPVLAPAAAGCGCAPATGTAASVCGCAAPAAPVVADALIKGEVLRYYDGQASRVTAGVQDGCCSPGLPADISCTTMYSATDLRSVPADALLASLGCGNPLARADLRPGEVVLDLGSGGGMDVLVAAGRVAPEGRVYGLDMSDQMLALARANASRVGASNVEFLKGEMESIPLPDASVDVIISNCVVNLAPDKGRALSEAFRVLRPGGRLAISDIATRQPVPPALKASLTAWAACVGGALSEDEYRAHLAASGFEEIDIQRDREYTATDAEAAGLGTLLQQMNLGGVVELGFASTSVRARRPAPAPAEVG